MFASTVQRDVGMSSLQPDLGGTYQSMIPSGTTGIGLGVGISGLIWLEQLATNCKIYAWL